MPRFRKIALVLLLVLGVIGAILLLWRKAEVDLVAFVIEQSGGEVVPTRVDGTLNGTLTLRDTSLFVVADVPTPVKVGEVRRATAQLDWDLYQRTKKAWPRKVTLEGFELALRVDDNNDLIFPRFEFDGDPNSPEPDLGPETGMPEPPPADPTAWPVQKYGDRQVQIRLDQGTVHYHLPALEHDGLPPLTVTQITAEAIYADRRLLQVTSLEGLYQEAPLSASGSFWYRRDRPYAIATTLGPLGIQGLLEQFGEAPRTGFVEGDVTLTGTITGKKGESVIEGSLKAAAMVFNHLGIEQIDLPFFIREGSLELREGRIEAFGGGIMVNGTHHSKRVAVTGPASTLQLRIEGINPGQAFAALGQPNYGLEGSVTGGATLTLDRDQRIAAEIELETEQFEVAGLPCTDLVAYLSYADGGIRLRDTRFVPPGGGRVFLSGQAHDVATWGKSPAAATLRLENIHFGTILQDLQLPTYGVTGRMGGTVTYTLKSATDWQAQVELNSTQGTMLSPFAADFAERVKSGKAKGGSLMPYSLIDLRATVRPKRLQLTSLKLRAPDFHLDVSGQVTDPQPVALTGTIRARKSVARAMRKVGSYIRHVPGEKDGFVQFKFSVGGTVANAEFDPELEANISGAVKNRLKDLF